MAQLHTLQDVYRILLNNGFFKQLETALFGSDVRCADIMLELNNGKMIRNREFNSLHDAIKKFLPDLFSYHLGGIYSDVIHRKPLIDSISIERRVFCMDIDCGKMLDGAWYSHCLYVCLLAARIQKCFMPGPADATLICYTGKGWHIYCKSERLSVLPTEGRRAIRMYTKMHHFFKLSKPDLGYSTDPSTGLMQHDKAQEWNGGCLYSGQDDSRTLVFDVEWYQGLLLQHESFFMVASLKRQEEWLKEGGIVISMLDLLKSNAQSFAGKEKIESLQTEVRKRNIHTMAVLLKNLSRISLFCKNQKDPSIISDEQGAKSVMMYACIMHDAAVCNLHTDVGMDSPGHMLRGILAPKRRGEDLHFSNPLGNVNDALRHLQETATLTLQDIQPGGSISEQPKLCMALKHFSKWAETKI